MKHRSAPLEPKFQNLDTVVTRVNVLRDSVQALVSFEEEFSTLSRIQKNCSRRLKSFL